MIYLTAVAMVNALGSSLNEIADNLQAGRSGLVRDDEWLLNHKTTYIGKVTHSLPTIAREFLIYNTRNNQLLLAALEQIQNQLELAKIHYGNKRIAVIMGSSTTGIYEGELAINQYSQQGKLPAHYYYQQQEMGDLAAFLANYLELEGPAYTISTACTSSARAIISGKRLIEAGIVDAALVGGADTLCQLSLNGFDSLGQISANPCMPFAKDRDGISIGEAAGLMLLTKQPAEVALLGIGESSDAWHMSAPQPEGIGAEKSIRMALQEANLKPEQIGYINMHGTATLLNDQMEAKAVNRVFGAETAWCSSTKHLTGHTLGAAGITEAALCWIMLERELSLPQQDFSMSLLDDTLAPINLIQQPHVLPSAKVMLSNSCAFGGNNTSILIGKVS